MNIAAHLVATARSFGSRPAVSFGTRLCWNYAMLAERAARLARGLRDLGCAPGDRVAIAMKNCPQYFEILYGIWHAGLCAVPLNAKLHPRELAFAVENSQSRVLFVTGELGGEIAPLTKVFAFTVQIVDAEDAAYESLLARQRLPLEATIPRQPAWLFYTSGTTGRPKGAILSHEALQAMILRYFADIDAVNDLDCMLHPAPMSHGTGLYALPHIAKGSHQVIPASGGFDPEEIFELTHTFENMTFFTVPTMLNRLVLHPRLSEARLESIKTIFYGGSPMYLEDAKRALRTLGPRLVQIYGQGEMPNTITCLSKRLHNDASHPRYEERLASVGIARTGVQIRVVNASGQDLLPGEIGEVIARSDVCMEGYWGNPEATSQTLRDGWLHTGDLGVLSEDGFLTLKDRSKDLIKSGGSNVYPREVEEVLLLHPEVREVSVIGAPHPDWGEEVVAFVVSRSGAPIEPAELDRICLEHIARYKRPKQYRFINELPKSGYGKALKMELRKLLNPA